MGSRIAGMYEYVSRKTFYKYVMQAQCLNLIAQLLLMNHLKGEKFINQLVSLANRFVYIHPESIRKRMKPGAGDSQYYRVNPWLNVGIVPPGSPVLPSRKRTLYVVTVRDEEVHITINLPKVIHHQCTIATLPENGAILLGIFGPGFIRESVDCAQYRLMVPMGLASGVGEPDLPFEPHHVREVADLVEGREFTELEIEVFKGLGLYHHLKPNWKRQEGVKTKGN